MSSIYENIKKMHIYQNVSILVEHTYDEYYNNNKQNEKIKGELLKAISKKLSNEKLSSITEEIPKNEEKNVMDTVIRKIKERQYVNEVDTNSQENNNAILVESGLNSDELESLIQSDLNVEAKSETLSSSKSVEIFGDEGLYTQAYKVILIKNPVYEEVLPNEQENNKKLNERKRHISNILNNKFSSMQSKLTNLLKNNKYRNLFKGIFNLDNWYKNNLSRNSTLVQQNPLYKTNQLNILGNNSIYSQASENGGITKRVSGSIIIYENKYGIWFHNPGFEGKYDHLYGNLSQTSKSYLSTNENTIESNVLLQVGGGISGFNPVNYLYNLPMDISYHLDDLFDKSNQFLPLNIIYNSVNFLLENILTNITDPQNELAKTEILKIFNPPDKNKNPLNNKIDKNRPKKTYNTMFSAKLLYYYIYNYNEYNSDNNIDKKKNNNNNNDKPNKSNTNIIELLILSDDISSGELSYKKKLRKDLMDTLYSITSDNNSDTRKIMIEVIYNFFELIDKTAKNNNFYNEGIKNYIEKQFDNSFYSYVDNFIGIKNNIEIDRNGMVALTKDTKDNETKHINEEFKKIIGTSKSMMIMRVRRNLKDLFENPSTNSTADKQNVGSEFENSLIFMEDSLKYIKSEPNIDEDAFKNFKELINYIKFENLIDNKKKIQMSGIKRMNYKKDYLDHAMFRFGLVKISAALLAFKDNFAKFSYQVQKQNYILGVRTISEAKKSIGKDSKLIQTTDENLFNENDLNDIEKKLLNNNFNASKPDDIRNFCKVGILNLLQYYKLYIEKLLNKEPDNSKNDINNEDNEDNNKKNKYKGDFILLKKQFDTTITKMLMFLRCNMFYNDYLNKSIFQDKIKNIFLEYDKKVKEYSNIIVLAKPISYIINEVEIKEDDITYAFNINNNIFIEPLTFEIKPGNTFKISLDKDVKLSISYQGNKLEKGTKQLRGFLFEIEADSPTGLQKYFENNSSEVNKSTPSSLPSASPPSPSQITYQNFRLTIKPPTIIQLQKDENDLELFDVQKQINKEIDIVNSLIINDKTLYLKKSEGNNIDENNSFIKLVDTINEFNNKGDKEFLTSEENLLSDYYKTIKDTNPELLEITEEKPIIYIFDEKIFIPNIDYLSCIYKNNTKGIIDMEFNNIGYNYDINPFSIKLKDTLNLLFKQDKIIIKNKGGKNNILSKIITKIFYLDKENVKSAYIKLNEHLKNIYNKYNNTYDDNESSNKVYFMIKKENENPSFLEEFIEFLNRPDIINNFSVPEEISNFFKIFNQQPIDENKFKYKYEFILCNNNDDKVPFGNILTKDLKIIYHNETDDKDKDKNKKSELCNASIDLLKENRGLIRESVQNLDYVMQLNAYLNYFKLTNYDKFNTINPSVNKKIKKSLNEIEKKTKPIIENELKTNFTGILENQPIQGFEIVN